jgi:two-component system NtrC family sensor kinase
MPLNRIHKLSWIYDLNWLGQEDVEAKNASVIYQRILQHIVDGFEAESGSLALLDQAGSTLTIVAGIELPKGVIGIQVNLGEGVLGWVAREKRALLLNGDASSDPRFQRHREGREKVSANSSICWPLKMGENTIGCISVNRTIGGTASAIEHKAPHPFVENDLKQGSLLLDLVSLALSNIQLHLDQQTRFAELQQMSAKLAETQSHLMQSEKMASVGQLAAGVAHEINNPIGFVYSNLGTLEKYVQDTFGLLDLYEAAEGSIADAGVLDKISSAKNRLDINFIKQDLRALMHESRDGIVRVKNIVQNLKDFSHVDDSEKWQLSDLHKGLDSTLSMVNNEIKYKAETVKEYGDLPEVECLASQLNQVFMNLLVNAAHAIDGHGTITIRTGREGDEVWVDIADTGQGISPEHMQKIFDPFFTTKPVGKGTGLGLSLSYGIVQKHHSRIEVQSGVGKGATFRVWLPILQPQGGRA